MRALAVVVTIAACNNASSLAPPPAQPPCDRLEPVAKLFEAQLADEARSPLHAAERVDDPVLVPRRLVRATGPLGDPSTADYLAIGKTAAKATSPDGKAADLALDHVAGWPVTSSTLVIAPQPDAPWRSIVQALAYARDQRYATVSIAYLAGLPALAAAKKPAIIAAREHFDLATWIATVEAELQAHCPAMHDSFAQAIRHDPGEVLRPAAEHVRACSCDVDLDKLASIAWVVAKPGITLAPVGAPGSAPMPDAKPDATWADVSGTTHPALALPAP